MNKVKWLNKHYSIERWLAKLMEEVGEVAEAFRHYDEDGSPTEYLHIIDELDHVIFIAGCMRSDLVRSSATP
jgi:NTP pyrophosphatase (non-canonical NTP hydrolase)